MQGDLYSQREVEAGLQCLKLITHKLQELQKEVFLFVYKLLGLFGSQYKSTYVVQLSMFCYTHLNNIFVKEANMAEEDQEELPPGLHQGGEEGLRKTHRNNSH